MPACVRDLLAFMTRLPLGGGSLEGAARCFYAAPLLGLAVGSLAFAPLAMLKVVGAPGLLAGSVYPAIHYLLTGGLHLDGLADYADVWGSGARGDVAVRVLKDPRRGSHAIAALATVTLASAGAAASIYALGLQEALALFIAAYAAAYESMYLTLLAGPPEPYKGMAAAFKRSASRTYKLNLLLYAVTAFSLAAATSQLAAPALAAVAAVLAATPALGLLVAADAAARLGFVNGDVAGASFETSRTLALLAGAVLALAGAAA